MANPQEQGHSNGLRLPLGHSHNIYYGIYFLEKTGLRAWIDWKNLSHGRVQLQNCLDASHRGQRRWPIPTALPGCGSNRMSDP